MMHVHQWQWSDGDVWPTATPDHDATQLVLVFGSTPLFKRPDLADALCRLYPGAQVAGCSTSGEILGTTMYDDTLTVTGIRFDRSGVRMAVVTPLVDESLFETGERLGAALPATDPAWGPLAHIVTLADGLHFIKGDFALGLEATAPPHVDVTGGLAGDGALFSETVLWANGVTSRPTAIAIGFYGEDLLFGSGADGGWDPFGPERLITRSEDQFLFELDGQNALDLYKRYLGPFAERLPDSGLLFPVSIRPADAAYSLVRTPLGISEADQSIRFAGDIPTGAYARFVRANVEQVIDGAGGAAEDARADFADTPPQFALLVSCVGRRWAFPERIEEELDEIRELVGDAPMTGFYSYGEFAPALNGSRCEFHNQTMTITLMAER
jgi:hypothetical protein